MKRTAKIVKIKMHIHYTHKLLLLLGLFSFLMGCAPQEQAEMNDMDQWLYFLLIGIVVMGALVGGLFFYQRRREEKRVYELQMTINSLRLDNLRTRISPHFIFNVLNHEMQRLNDKVDKSNLFTFVHLLRRQLELADQISISLTDELDFVKCFLDLEKDSLGKDFEFVLDVDDSVDLNEISIPSMFIYLLVENAVKHSLMMKESQRKLWIRIWLDGDRTEIKVCDNGGGFKVGRQTVGTGTGFKVITRTIQLYNQYNKSPIYMQIHNVELANDETGCEVSYSIPKDYKFIIKS